MNRRAFGIRLQYADGRARALVVNALNEKAAADRKAALELDGGDTGPSSPAELSRELVAQRALASELRDQADFAEQIADELEAE